MRTVHVVVPDAVADPARPSGGNAYDRRLCAGLDRLGWSVKPWALSGPWPGVTDASRAAAAAVLAGLPDGAVALLDGLVASALPEVLVPERRRLRLVVLVHLPLGLSEPGCAGTAGARRREREVLGAVAAVVVTSRWTRAWLRRTYALAPERLHVAPPGVDAGRLTVPSASGHRLLCVGAVTPTKGQDVLAGALAALRDHAWSCRCVGSTDVAPAFAQRVGAAVVDGGLGGRVALTGPMSADGVDAAYADADLVVVPSRTETYGMVVTEALARGLPVLASDVGGVPEALGHAPGGGRPGILVPPGSPAPLAATIRWWLTDAGLRERLRTTALLRRPGLSDWGVTAERVDAVLSAVAA